MMWTAKLRGVRTGRRWHGPSFPGLLPLLAPRALQGPERLRVNYCRWQRVSWDLSPGS